MDYQFSGKTIEDALEKACNELNLSMGSFSYEVEVYPNKGFLGIGSKPAVIKVKNNVDIEDSGKKEKKSTPQINNKENLKVKEKEAVRKQSNKSAISKTKEKNKEVNDSIIKKDVSPKKECIDSKVKDNNSVKGQNKNNNSYVEYDNCQLKDFIKGIFNKMDINDYDIKMEKNNDDIINIVITGEEADILTKRQAEAVDGLQVLLGLFINKENKTHIKVLVDINNCKQRSADRLEALALKTAKQVLSTKRRITLNSMSSYQRRIVHSKLQNMKNITTYSVGSEPNRRVVVAYQYNDGQKKTNYKKNPAKAETSTEVH